MDISDFDNIEQINEIETNGLVSQIEIQESYLYYTDESEFKIIDMDNPREPDMIFTTGASRFQVDGEKLLRWYGINVKIYNNSDRAQPRQIWTGIFPRGGPYYYTKIQSVIVDGEYLYMVYDWGWSVGHNTSVEGSDFLIYNISEQDTIIRVYAENLEEYCLEGCQLMAYSKEHAFIKIKNRVVIYSVEDPEHPRHVESFAGLWKPEQVSINGNYALVANERDFLVYDCSEFLTVDTEISLSPISFDLFSYPNPFNSSTVVNFKLLISGEVGMILTDPLGRIVSDLIPMTQLNAGNHSLTLNNKNLSSGVYYLNLKTGSGTESIPVHYLK